MAFGLLGIAQSAYDPSMQAHVGDVVPLERRGRAMGIVELSWSGSWLIGVPAAGFLMARYGWQAPFVVIAVLGFLCAILTLDRSGKSVTRRRQRAMARPSERPRSLHEPSAALSRGRSSSRSRASALILLANESLFLVYGALMEDHYNLALGALGLASIIVSAGRAGRAPARWSRSSTGSASATRCSPG